MAPTPEQEAEMKKVLHEALEERGGTPGNVFGLYEVVVTVDQALEMFQMLKLAETLRGTWPECFTGRHKPSRVDRSESFPVSKLR